MSPVWLAFRCKVSDAAGSPVRKACIQPSHEMIIIELLITTGVELVKYYAGTGSKNLSKGCNMLPGTCYTACAHFFIFTEPRVLRPPSSVPLRLTKLQKCTDSETVLACAVASQVISNAVPSTFIML